MDDIEIIEEKRYVNSHYRTYVADRFYSDEDAYCLRDQYIAIVLGFADPVDL